MSDYIFLLDNHRCPSCRHRGKLPKPSNGFCGNCGQRLFSGTHHDFRQMTYDGMLGDFWCYTEDRGWAQADHFLVRDAKPNPRVVDSKPLPHDYGRKTTPGKVAAMGGRITKRMRSKLL